MLRSKLTFANVMVVILTFIVLGGGAYAMTSLPANSVGTRQIRDGAVTGPKLAKSTLRELERLVKKYSPAPDHLTAGPPGAQGPIGLTGPQGPKGDPGLPGGTVPGGVTLRGVVVASMTEPTSGSFAIGTGVSFGGSRLSSRPVAHLLPPEASPTKECPGSNAEPEATGGNLCIYLTGAIPGTGQVIVFDPSQAALSGINYNLASKETTKFADGTISQFGFQLDYDPASTNSAQLRGTWAVTP